MGCFIGCENKYELQERGTVSVYSYSACWTNCMLSEKDEYDTAFRSAKVRYGFDEFQISGKRVLFALEKEADIKADVESAKILYLMERLKGKLHRRETALKRLDEYNCKEQYDNKNYTNAFLKRCLNRGSRLYQKQFLKKSSQTGFKSASLPEIKEQIIVNTYKSKQKEDYIPVIGEKLLKAAKLKNTEAQFLLHAVYELGIGVNVDLIESRAWLEVAVSQDPPFGSHLIEYSSKFLDAEQTSKALGRAQYFRKQYTNLYEQPAKVILQ